MVIKMNSKVKILLFILAFAVFIGLSYAIYTALAKDSSDSTGGFNIGSVKNLEDISAKHIKAPDFTVKDADGNDVKLSSFIGKPIVLNLWASWCGPCKNELPDFQSAYDELKNDVTFVMVNLTYGSETQSSAKSFLAEKGYTFPVYFDIGGSASDAYAVSSIPASYFIDKDGYLVTRSIGMLTESGLKTAIAMINK